MNAVRHKRVRRERNAQLQQRQRRNVLNVNCMWIVNAFEFMFVLYDMYMYFFPLYFFNLGDTRLCECMCVRAFEWCLRIPVKETLYALCFIHTFHPLNEIVGSISFMFWEEAICIEMERERERSWNWVYLTWPNLLYLVGHSYILLRRVPKIINISYIFWIWNASRKYCSVENTRKIENLNWVVV